MHGHDDRWPDLSASGRTDRLAFIASWTAVFEAFRDEDLTLDEQVDRDVILGVIRAIQFAEVSLREEAWSPMAWVYLVGEGFFGLISREFAPFAERLASLAARAERLPAVIDGLRETLVGLPGRPVDRFHTEKALEQWPGLIGLVDEAIVTAEAAAAEDPAVAAILPRLRTARTIAADGLAAIEGHLRSVVLPASAGEGRLGPELFASKMVHTMKDPTLTPDRIREQAEREFEAVRGEMIRIARRDCAGLARG